MPVILSCCDCGHDKKFSPSELSGKCARYLVKDGVYRCRPCWNILRRSMTIRPLGRTLFKIECVDCGIALQVDRSRMLATASPYVCMRCRSVRGRKRRAAQKAVTVARARERQARRQQAIEIRQAALARRPDRVKLPERVEVQCDGCGKTRMVSRQAAKRIRLCMSCSRSGDRSGAWQGGGVLLVCVKCGREKQVSRSRAAASRREDGSYFCWECALDNKPSGPANHAWKGGVSFAPYPLEWTPALKRKIRRRDEHTCAVCGLQDKVRCRDVHHIDYDKNNCDPSNLVTLCRPCHPKTNFSRARWKERLTRHMKNRGFA